MSNNNNNVVWHNYDILNCRFQVPSTYKNLIHIGRGVCSADCERTNTRVAIKLISQVFSREEQSRRVYREITLLKRLQHENIIGLLDLYYKPDVNNRFSSVYLVMDHMTTNLGYLIRANQITPFHAKFFTYQIFRGLKYLHSADIIHRDLKPANLVVNQEGELKIIDFGLARPINMDMTEYVVTRPYRAPELLLNWQRYTKAVDIWSVGCIMVEMALGSELFNGEALEQFNKILEVTGFPTDRFLNKLEPNSRELMMKMEKKPPRKNFAEYFNCLGDPQAIDLVEKILRLDPEDRVSVEETLEHPYLAQHHDADDEPTTTPFADENEAASHTTDEWREIIKREIDSFQAPPSN